MATVSGPTTLPTGRNTRSCRPRRGNRGRRGHASSGRTHRDGAAAAAIATGRAWRTDRRDWRHIHASRAWRQGLRGRATHGREGGQGTICGLVDGVGEGAERAADRAELDGDYRGQNEVRPLPCNRAELGGSQGRHVRDGTCDAVRCPPVRPVRARSGRSISRHNVRRSPQPSWRRSASTRCRTNIDYQATPLDSHAL